jgi:molybdate transport system ATP-binding protein
MTLQAHFTKRRGATTVQADLVDVCQPGRVLVLFGPSGCGKTTTLRCLAGLEHPDAGSIRFDDEPWFDAATRVARTPQQRSVGFVPQDYALFPHLSVDDNIEFGLSSLPADDRRQRRQELVSLLQLTGLGRRRPAALSGGQQQRVALARAVATRPRLLLLDEPLSALDAATRAALRRELRGLLTTLRTPAVVVTHDRIEALALGDDVVVMDAGRMLQCGPTADVFSRPATVDAARVVGVETVERGRIVGEQGGLATVRIGDAHVQGLSPAGSGGDVVVLLRAEDVVLDRGAGAQSSGRNRLPGRVVDVIDEGALIRVVVDVGFLLTAVVTRQSRDDLAIAVGDEIVAVCKATAVHLVRA